MEKFFKDFLFVLVILFLFSCSPKNYDYPVWIDEIPVGQVINYYGSPEINKSFGGDSIRIKNKTFERGLGTHAPSDLKVQIGKRDLVFEAYIGIDSKLNDYRNSSARKLMNNFPDYIYDAQGGTLDYNQGGTAVFKVFADNQLIYESPVLDKNNPPVKVRLKINNVQNIRLVTEPYEDGSFTDHTNWANVRLFFTEEIHPSSLLIYSSSGEIMHNQGGYKPDSYKKCVMSADTIDSLYIYDYHTNELVYKNTINFIAEDIGKYLTADFSELRKPGSYYLSSAGKHSGKFEISDTIFNNHIKSYLSFIKTIRLNYKEWEPFMNLNDKNLPGNGANQKFPVARYDGDQYRQALSKSVQLLYTLSVLKEFNKDCLTDSLVMEEIEYVNRFLKSLQETGGYLTSSDNFDWNVNRGNSGRKDSIIRSLNKPGASGMPLSLYNQFIYSMTQARLARLLRNNKLEAQKSISAAEDCFSWATLQVTEQDACVLGAAIGAACELYNSGNNSVYKTAATKYTVKLLQLFDSTSHVPFGLFKTTFTDSLSFIEKDGDPSIWPVAGLCLYVKSFPEDKLAEECKKIINSYCFDVIKGLSRKNAFDLIPYALYENYIVGSKARDNYYYRLFGFDVSRKQPGHGTISYITSAAAGLVMASEVLNKPELLFIAQRQLDWVLGCNPFNLSFVTGIGYRHPPPFQTPGYSGPGIAIHGGVMKGISADINDSPAAYPGWKQTSGYCIEAVANMIWLTSLLDR